MITLSISRGVTTSTILKQLEIIFQMKFVLKINTCSYLPIHCGKLYSYRKESRANFFLERNRIFSNASIDTAISFTYICFNIMQKYNIICLVIFFFYETQRYYSMYCVNRKVGKGYQCHVIPRRLNKTYILKIISTSLGKEFLYFFKEVLSPLNRSSERCKARNRCW